MEGRRFPARRGGAGGGGGWFVGAAGAPGPRGCWGGGGRRPPPRPAITTACIRAKSSWGLCGRLRPEQWVIHAYREHRLEVMTRVHLERDVRVRSGDAG